MDADVDDALLSWLLEGDPAVRWRVLRDLTDATNQEVARERARVATDGWGARLLAVQDRDGHWGGGVYSPKWTSTTYTLLHLLWLGLPPRHPAALRGCERLWEWQARWRGAGDLHRQHPRATYQLSRVRGGPARRPGGVPDRPAAGRRRLELRHPHGQEQAQLVPHQHPGAGSPRCLHQPRRSGRLERVRATGP